MAELRNLGLAAREMATCGGNSTCFILSPGNFAVGYLFLILGSSLVDESES